MSQSSNNKISLPIIYKIEVHVAHDPLSDDVDEKATLNAISDAMWNYAHDANVQIISNLTLTKMEVLTPINPKRISVK
tara:strand:- start:452 stop:685 length:234 start_codon:yes stop_codon:yes gene_type:complete